jgi:hypothetical protein
MPLRLEIKKELSSRSERVKGVDIHAADRPWVLCALYNGNVLIWDYTTNVSVRMNRNMILMHAILYISFLLYADTIISEHQSHHVLIAKYR